MIYRPDQGSLIVRPTADPDCPWDLPGGRHISRTDPELELRRLCHEQVGCDVQVLAGRPAVPHGHGSGRVVYRLYMCTVAADEALPLGCAAVRWVPRAGLSEFAFAAGIGALIQP